MKNEQMTVLVADDDATTRTVLSKILENAGYRVLTADRGEKCLFLALEKKIDAFLVDISMPGLSGIDICQRIRAMEPYKVTPIIFITSMDDNAKLSEAFEAGATDFISKPANQVVLTARLHSHLQKVTYFRELERIRNYSNRYISTRTRRMVEAYATTGLPPAPELHRVCIMFTDIRGFTSITHEVELETLFQGLSDHLGMQVEKVYKYGGYIDKFGGDGLMAIFDDDDMAVQACYCALEIIEASTKFVKIADKHKLPVGIGIHYGEVMIGNIGSAEHLDYSAIGETVNIAARLCGHAEPMNVNVSEDLIKFAESDPALQFSAPTPVKLKGMNRPLPVFQLIRSYDRPVIDKALG
ncbi:MAG: adenylate/guanylate cyclase domain-containing protein [Gammaproteobacteria bacterium]